jgi:hypothetical protein
VTFAQIHIPAAYAQEEPNLDIPYASKPVTPVDLGSGDWMKPEMWEDSIEVAYYPNVLDKKEAYLRLKWDDNNLAVLVDAVTDTAEKPFGSVRFGFDTYNMRKEVKDPTVPGTPGYYSLYVGFVSPGGPLKNYYAGNPQAPGHPFPSEDLHYTWSRGPSPIANDNEVRLKPHALYCFLFSKKLLTSKYNEIGFHTFLGESQQPTIRLAYPPSPLEYASAKFSTIPISELRDAARAAIDEANATIRRALDEGRTEGIDDARSLLDNASGAFHKTEYQRAADFASQAKKLAEQGAYPQNYYEAKDLLAKARDLRSSVLSANFTSADAQSLVRQGLDAYTSGERAFSSHDFTAAIAYARSAIASFDQAFAAEQSYREALEALEAQNRQGQQQQFTYVVVAAGTSIVIAAVVVIYVIRKKSTKPG